MRNFKFYFGNCLFLMYIFTCLGKIRKSSNFVFVLTDDQDLVLNGMVPMINSTLFIQEKGAELTNMFVNNPLCCPSRASILTGRYSHTHGVVNNSISGNCNSLHWQKGHEKDTFIIHLKNNNYTTFYAGKYLNTYGSPDVGGVEHIPPGWDWWLGLVGNSRYYNYTLSVNGTAQYHGDDPTKDYLTDVIGNHAYQFLRSAAALQKPFFMMLAPPAPHAPFTPSPEFMQNYSHLSAPRTPNFNVPGGKTKHWLLRQPPNPLPEVVIKKIDDVFRNRWRTLLSVDKMIGKLYYILKERRLLHSTYIILSSDNGFHLGQFSLPWDKRQLYEFDIRVPLVMRGPGITPGTRIKEPVVNIDIAPTILELSGVPVPPSMDGKSFASLLLHPATSTPSWRRHFVVEHQGESGDSAPPGCPQYSQGGVHMCEPDCICEDSWNNTYLCLRTLSSTKDTVFCTFDDHEDFTEIYDLSLDPYQLHNLAQFQNFNKVENNFLRKKLSRYY